MSRLELEALICAVSGTFGSLLSNMIVFPLERIRLQMQIEVKDQKENKCGSSYSNMSCVINQGQEPSKDVVVRKNENGGFIDCVGRIYTEGGIVNLYKGLPSMLLGVSVSQFVFLSVYTYLKYMKLRKDNCLSLFHNLGIAGVAGLFSAIISNPFWIVNTRLSLNSNENPKYDGIVDCFQKLYQKRGLNAFYSGLFPALVLIVNPVIQFVCYEQITRFFLLARSRKTNVVVLKLSPSEYLFIGSVSKAIATLITYPYFLIKGRMHAGEVTNSWNMIRNIFADNGFSGLFEGMCTKFPQAVINSAIMFALYEQFKTILRARLQ